MIRSKVISSAIGNTSARRLCLLINIDFVEHVYIVVLIKGGLIRQVSQYNRSRGTCLYCGLVEHVYIVTTT